MSITRTARPRAVRALAPTAALGLALALTGCAGDEVPALPQRHVDGPVVAGRLGELAGAVERVDDPDPVGVEACLVVAALLGEHRVVGAVLGQRVLLPGAGAHLGHETLSEWIARR